MSASPSQKVLMGRRIRIAIDPSTPRPLVHRRLHRLAEAAQRLQIPASSPLTAPRSAISTFSAARWPLSGAQIIPAVRSSGARSRVLREG